MSVLLFPPASTGSVEDSIELCLPAEKPELPDSGAESSALGTVNGPIAPPSGPRDRGVALAAG